MMTRYGKAEGSECGHPSSQRFMGTYPKPRPDFVSIPTTKQKASELWHLMPSDCPKVREMFIELLSTGHVPAETLFDQYTAEHVDILQDCIRFKFTTRNCLVLSLDDDGLRVGSFGNPWSHY